jgi:oligopeptidase B
MLDPGSAPPPVAPRRPVEHLAHGDARPDEYHWLANRDDPEVIAYLQAENAYANAVLSPTRDLQELLFERARLRVAETDVSPPVFHHGWWYWSETIAGKQYPVHCRRAGPAKALSAAEVLAAARAALPGAGVAGDGTLPSGGGPSRLAEGAVGRDGSANGRHLAPGARRVILDENELAGESEYFALGVFDLRPDQDVLAYAVDYLGAERYTLRFRDLGSGEDLRDVVEDVYYGSAWSTTGKSFYYVRPDKAMRPWQVWEHTLGAPAARDRLVFQEDDERFHVSVSLSRSKCFILIKSASKTTSEVRYFRADRGPGRLGLVMARRDGVDYDVDHARRPGDGRDFWLVCTNRGPDGERLEDFGVFELPFGEPSPSALRPLLPYCPGVRVESAHAFAKHIVSFERQGGLAQIRAVDLTTKNDHVISQPEPAYSLGFRPGLEWETSVARFSYSSLTRPPETVDYDMERREGRVVKRATVGGGFDPDDWCTERIWAVAKDATPVPISLVYRAGQPRDGSAPCLLYGYGSYESSVDAAFSHIRLNLLERGFIYAIAHVRGGGEMGRAWYEQGRLSNKNNTFTDFIACAEKLVADGWTSPERLVIRGRSAGGLLVGAATNLCPRLFRAVIAEVPFVDVVTTMSDEALPLTVAEWEEWGNPRDDPAAYQYMKAYSPYDNVHEGPHPAMYVTAALNDPRVGYWEPAKWVARLRATNTGPNPVLLHTETGRGHGGPSGRYDAWRDEARVQVFALAAVGDAD